MGETDIHQIILQIVIHWRTVMEEVEGSRKEVWALEVGPVRETSLKM